MRPRPEGDTELLIGAALLAVVFVLGVLLIVIELVRELA